MTDRSGALRDWRVVLAAGSAVLVAAVVTLVVRTGDPATADSYLSDVHNVAVVLHDGSVVSAHEGQRVPPGAAVRTGADGGATLSTAGRAVYVGARTTLRVVDGVHEGLDRGQVMVDARGGPQLLLDTRAGAADIARGALVRVETGPVLRLGSFVGSASLRAAGRQARKRVPELYQLLAPYNAVPGRPTALALTDDGWEQRLAAELVNADKDLFSLARGLAAAAGTTVLQAAPVALRQEVLPGNDRGEQALSVAIAQTSHRQGPLSDTLSFVLQARGEGGSWGVVAALVHARVTAVSALLDTVLAPPGSTTVPPVLAGASPAYSGLFTPTPSSGTSPAPSRSGSPQPTATRRPSTNPRPPSPTPTNDLLTTVIGMLSASPSAASTSLLPLPLPLPKLR